MDSREEEVHLLALLAVSYVDCGKKKRKRKHWCKQWVEIKKRFTHINLISELKEVP